MKAIIYTKYGPPEVLKLKEVEKPTPKEDEVLIRVYASTVNRTDCAMLRAKPYIMRMVTGLFKPRNTIPGTDFAGKIEVVGKNVSSYKAGDRVFGFDDIGLRTKAQFMKLSESKPFTIIPNHITYEHAAASLEGAHYAYNFINKIHLKKGQKVLVNGATGAIGSAAVQLLKYYGANVTAVCKAENFTLIKSIGADRLIDYTKVDFTQSAEKYHYVFDTVGKSSFAKCRSILEPGGIYISSELGSMIQNPILALITPFIGDKKVIFPIPTNKKRSILLVKKLLEEGKFTPLIDRNYKLEEITAAYEYVEKGEKIGNVIILMQPDS